MKREEILSALEGSPQSFVELLKSQDLDMSEFLQALSRKMQARVWSALLPLARDVAVRLVDGENTSNEDSSNRKAEGECEDVEVLSGVVTVCKCALTLENLNFTNELCETLQIIHDILLSVPDDWCELQNSMSQLCEACWERGEEVEVRETLVPNCLLYLVARTFSQGATVKDVGRVWGMRGALLLLDFEDPSADSIKELLLSSLIEPLYLTSGEGKKLLSYLFGLHPSFVDSLHQTIRNQIPWCPKAYLEVYGEVYFKSWRLASGPYLKKIEEHCIQDLMYTAVHANRTGLHAVFPALRKLLRYIHQQTQHNGVSEMILRLYNPFLWRSLKVANAHVRANAVCLMLDAFPLHDPSSTREEIDSQLQRQFDLMAELLFDDSPMVRSLTVLGVGRALCRFWELVPLSVIKSLLVKMIRELAHDTSSDDVRVAAIQSLSIILENRLSHAVLRDLLPLLKNHIHDTSVKVRIAFLEMLLVVQGIRSIKFYGVCSIPHLLARMDIDSIHVVKRIVSLLVSSFQPSSVPISEQVARCLTLIEMNTAAARTFYRLVVTHLPPSHVVRFMLALYTTVRHAVEEKGEEEGEEGEGDKKKKKERGGGRRGKKRGGKGKMEDELKNHATNVKKEDFGEEGEKGEEERDPSGIAEGGWKEGEKEGDTSSTRDPPSLSDRDLLAGALEVIVILWEGLKEALDSPNHNKLRSRLVSTVTESLPLLFNSLTDGRCRSALYFMASFLPKRSVSAIVRGTLETLSSLDTNSQDYAAMVTAMTSWKQIGDVLCLVARWLKTALEEAMPRPHNEAEGQRLTTSMATKNHKKSRGKGKKTSGGSRAGEKVMTNSESPGSKPQLALNILNYTMLHPLCREEMMKQKETWDLEQSLQQCLVVLDYHLSGEATLTTLTFDLLREMLSVYMRLALHRAGEEGGREGRGCEVVRGRVREVREWSEGTLLPLLRGELHSKAQPAKRHSNRKRKANQSQPTSDPRVKDGCQVTEMLLRVTTEAVMIGLTDSELQLELGQWAAAFAETAAGPVLLKPLTKLMYQLSEGSVLSEEVEGIRTVSSLIPIATLLRPLLQLAASVSSGSPEDFKKVWSVLNGGVSQVVSLSLRLHSLSLSPHSVPTFTTLTNLTMSLLSQDIKENPSRRRSDSTSLPPFPSAVLDIVARNENTASLFLSHLQTWLEDKAEERREEEGGEREEEGETDFSQTILKYLASLHPLSVLISNDKGCDEAMDCIRSGLRFVERVKSLGNGEEESWWEELGYISRTLESLQDRLYSY